MEEMRGVGKKPTGNIPEQTTYLFLTKEEVEKMARNYSVDAEGWSVPVFEGFRYFSPIDFKQQEIGTRFILATYKEEIVGVMKTKRYAQDNHAYVDEKEKRTIPNYIAIRYVDVREDFKRRGMASALYKHLNTRLNSSDTVISSPLSAEGEKAALHTIRTTYITHCSSFNSLEDWMEEEEFDVY